jgi:hypothetical protein
MGADRDAGGGAAGGDAAAVNARYSRAVSLAPARITPQETTMSSIGYHVARPSGNGKDGVGKRNASIFLRGHILFASLFFLLVALRALLTEKKSNMFPVIDVTAWERLNTEQMGTKPKFWCLDNSGGKFLFKESRSHTGENWSEKIAAEIAEVIGLPHAEIELAVCEGKNGTISRSFLHPTEPSSLVHGNELLFEHDPNYPISAPNFRLAQHSLDRVFSGLTTSGAVLPQGFAFPENVHTACDLFVGYLLLDALIVNTDRHHANWAVVIAPCMDGTSLVEIAPTFDHASSLGRELTDSRRRDKLRAERMRNALRKPARRDQTVVGYLEKEDGRSRIYGSEQDPKPLHPLQVFEKARERCPTAAEAWIDRLQEIELPRFEAIVAKIPEPIMSQPARDFSVCLIQLNYTALISRTFRYA